ncbi:MAG TPA: flagellar biosynthetic protein FliP [Spirochaetia bacterium]|nr:flagellar biosynthetic protein FliP [Spirochaetia bacterium]
MLKTQNHKNLKFTFFIKAFLYLLILGGLAQAQTRIPIPFIDLGIRQAAKPDEVSLSLQILFLLTILSIAPAIIIMTTAFVRVAIVLKFVQRALSLQQMPPDSVLMGFALFLTFFIMSPVITDFYDNAYVPYNNKKITTEQFFERTMKPVRGFMFKQTREKDISLFLYIAGKQAPKNQDDVPSHILIPAFLISELTTSFQIGIYLFIPFIIIDMIVSSILMSMGIIMLPPVMISLPFKIVLFVLVDGWHLLSLQLVRSFHM